MLLKHRGFIVIELEVFRDPTANQIKIFIAWYGKAWKSAMYNNL